MTIQAAAKINWYLKVLGRRPDGYHELEMLMQRIALYDDISVEAADDLHLDVLPGGIAVDMPRNEDNLVLRAARALKQYSGSSQGARIALLKRIPPLAGLGGGSADAAAVLHALNRLWQLNLSLQQLMAIGLPLGADIPYCLMDKPAIVTGMGEIIKPVYLGPPLWLVLLMPDQGLSTGKVFGRYDAKADDTQGWHMDSTLDAITRGHFSHLKLGSGNSLLKPAVALLPGITQHMEALRHGGAQFVQMTGAGSAVYGAFSAEQKARSAWEQLSPRYDNGRCVLTHTLP